MINDMSFLYGAVCNVLLRHFSSCMYILLLQEHFALQMGFDECQKLFLEIHDIIHETDDLLFIEADPG